MTEDEPITYNWIRGVEALEGYRHGGYHPVMVGDTVYNRYLIVDKLGSKGYSTVWLALDNKLDGYVALKIQGPNGTHTCYTVAPAQCNLREISYSRMFPLGVARALSYGVALAVAYIHSEGYVHGDIHLNNVLARLPTKAYDLFVEDLYKAFGNPETVTVTRVDGKPLPSSVPSNAVRPLFLGKYAEKFLISGARPLLSDFGEAFAPESETRLGRDSHTPATDSPLSYPANIWSLATAICEIMGMKVIFTNEYADEEEVQVAFLSMIRQMLVYRPDERLGAKQVMESEWMVKWAYTDYERSLEDPAS
ncbi:kinase-like domain-containing protein [Aspergillus insuetus]